MNRRFRPINQHMKRYALALAMAVIFVSGCAPAAPGDGAVTTGTPGYSESAPARLLDAPDRARDAAAAANARVEAEKEATPR
jgi:hypothetical protein